jgi:hypothetical protein
MCQGNTAKTIYKQMEEELMAKRFVLNEIFLYSLLYKR